MASVTEGGIAASTPVVVHPYSPAGVAIPAYAANTLATSEIFAIFSTAVSAILVPAYLYIRWARPNIAGRELATALWFVMCAGVHMVLEGYYAFNFRDISGHSTVLGQLWKEYSLSDSRYLTQDAFVACMETVTAVCWGPLSLAIAWCIAFDHPLRHPLQLIVSLGQLYGDVLYFATCEFQAAIHDLVHCRPERVYFYAYYVMMNAFWIVIPFCLIVASVREMVRVFTVVKAMEKGKKTA